jgi:hypothetical protein
VCPDHPRPIAGSPALRAWRTRPWRYHARHFDDLCAVLAELSLGAGERARSLIAVIVRDRASDDIWQLAVELARQPTYGAGDLPAAWAALAGARQHQLAALAVAQRLADLDCGISQRHRMLVAGWARLATIGAPSVLRRPEYYADQLRQPAAPPARDSGTTHPSLVADLTTAASGLADPYAVGTMVVVPGIGDAESREGRHLAKVYDRLLQPLPLRASGTDDLPGALLTEFPWLAEACDRVADSLALQSLSRHAHFGVRAMLLVGPPGTGKTRFARRLAEMAGVGFGRLDAGGSCDNRALAGTARGWSSAAPCWPLQVMAQTECANPVLSIDELEKQPPAGGPYPRVTERLLGLLERETAARYFDECLLTPADLSHVSWILTANDLRGIPGPLLSRVAVIRVGSPSPQHFDCVLGGILHDVAHDLACAASDLPPLTAAAIALLRKRFGAGTPIRKIRAAIEAALASDLRQRPPGPTH